MALSLFDKEKKWRSESEYINADLHVLRHPRTHFQGEMINERNPIKRSNSPQLASVCV